MPPSGLYHRLLTSVVQYLDHLLDKRSATVYSRQLDALCDQRLPVTFLDHCDWNRGQCHDCCGLYPHGKAARCMGTCRGISPRSDLLDTWSGVDGSIEQPGDVLCSKSKYTKTPISQNVDLKLRPGFLLHRFRRHHLHRCRACCRCDFLAESRIGICLHIVSIHDNRFCWSQSC